MKLINNPDRSQWAEILKRPVMNTENLFDTVRGIIDRVKSDGDRAVLEMEAKFDKAELTSLAVTEAELKDAETLVDEKLKAAIRLAKQNIETFHAAQRFEGKKVETMPGVTCWQKAVAIEKVGLYIPGGTAPLFSTVLMLAVPAKIAGCKEIVLCTPPDKEGRVHPAILFCRTGGRGEQDIQGRWRASYCFDGLRDGKRAEGLQDIRSGKPVCDGSETVGQSA